MDTTIDQLVMLPASERKRIINALVESLTDDEQNRACERYAVLKTQMERILGHSLRQGRKREDIVPRYIIASRLSHEGFSTTKVGRACGYDHSTIVHINGVIDAWYEFPTMYADEVTLYNRFTKAIIEYDTRAI